MVRLIMWYIICYYELIGSSFKVNISIRSEVAIVLEIRYEKKRSSAFTRRLGG